MRFIPGIVLLLLVSLFTGISLADTQVMQTIPWSAPEGSLPVWNGRDLTGWTSFGQPPPTQSLVQSSSDGILHLIGKPKGYLHTEESFANGHLHAEWRWPIVAKTKVNNSGIFIFQQSPDAIWPQGIQVQIKEGFSGDLIAMGSLVFPGRKNPTIPKVAPSNEKPVGEWNSVDVLFHTEAEVTTLQVFINGLLQNSLEIPALKAGHIALQSEGYPVDFRNLWLKQ